MLNEYNELLDRQTEDQIAGVEGVVTPTDVLISTAEEEQKICMEQAQLEEAVMGGVLLHSSMESYLNDFMTVAPVSEWNRSIARQYQTGLTAILQARGVTVELESYAPSFEAVDVTETAEDYHVGAIAKAKAFFAKIWAAIVAAVKALMESFSKWRANQKQRASAVRAAANDLEKLAKKHAGKYDAEVSKSFVSWFHGTKPAEEFRITKFSKPDYLNYEAGKIKPAEGLSILRKSIQDFNNDWTDGYYLVLEAVVKGIADNKVADISAGAKRVFSWDGGKPIPGGRKLSVKVGDKGNALKALTNATVLLGDVPSPEKASDEYIPMMGSADVVSLVSALRETAKYMDDVDSAVAKLQSTVDKMVKDSKVAMDKAAANEEYDEAKIQAHALAPLAVKATQSYRSLNSALGEYAQLTYTHAKASIARWSRVNVGHKLAK